MVEVIGGGSDYEEYGEGSRYKKRANVAYN